MHKTPLERFEDKINYQGIIKPNMDTNCHEWTASYTWTGHGQFDGEGTHRWAWKFYVGNIPKDKPCVLHRCDNPLCVRIEHLFLGTQEDNMKDMARKKRGNNQHKNITHCKHGHIFDEKNTRTYKGSRICRTCHNNREKNRQKKLKA